MPDVRRRVFWGVTTGYVLGMLATLIAIHYPATLWTGSGWRTAVVHWGMVVGAVLGAAVGLTPIRPITTKRSTHAPSS